MSNNIEVYLMDVVGVVFQEKKKGGGGGTKRSISPCLVHVLKEKMVAFLDFISI
jgi:uncharacterized spore protein YtfJ